MILRVTFNVLEQEEEEQEEEVIVPPEQEDCNTLATNKPDFLLRKSRSLCAHARLTMMMMMRQETDILLECLFSIWIHPS